MNKTRKTVPRITARALRKVRRFYYNGVHAYCTPAEYVCLCWYFDVEPDPYYIDKISYGDSRSFNAYIKSSQQIIKEFNLHPKAMSNTLMQ